MQEAAAAGRRGEVVQEKGQERRGRREKSGANRDDVGLGGCMKLPYRMIVGTNEVEVSAQSTELGSHAAPPFLAPLRPRQRANTALNGT